MKRAVGIHTPAPNEYEARRQDSLEVPPSYYLPNPGADIDAEPNKAAGDDMEIGDEKIDSEIEALLKDIDS